MLIRDSSGTPDDKMTTADNPEGLSAVIRNDRTQPIA
jgi:hypothetical protein